MVKKKKAKKAIRVTYKTKEQIVAPGVLGTLIGTFNAGRGQEGCISIENAHSTNKGFCCDVCKEETRQALIIDAAVWKPCRICKACILRYMI